MKIFQYCLFLTLGLSIAQTATAADIDGKVEQILIDSELNQALNLTLKQVNQFKHALEYLALLVYAEGNKFKDKTKILDYIQKTRLELSQLDEISFLVPEIGTILVMQKINQALCKNLQNALANHQWEDIINLGLVVQQHQSSTSDLSQIPTIQAQNQKDLDQLEATIERFGLTRTQRAIRSVEDAYQKIQFNIEKNKLEPYVKYAAIGAAVGAYLVYHSEYLAGKLPSKEALDGCGISKLWDNPVGHGLKKLIGSAPKYNIAELAAKREEDEGKVGRLVNMVLDPKYICSVTNEKELGVLGRAEKWLAGILRTESTPNVLVPGATLGWLANKTIGDNKYAVLGLHLYPDTTMHMASIVNDALLMKDSNRFKDFMADAKDFCRTKYRALRGKSSQGGLDQKPSLTFKDVIGLEQAKKTFDVVVDYIVEPEKFERTKLTPIKGYLMVGPPRTGKSHIAKAICGEINERQKLLGKPKTTSFISLDADLITEKNFYKLMEYINSKAPCVVFIDEIDLLCLNRGNGNKENKLLSQILTHMSGYVDTEMGKSETNADKHVIFIAATNNPYSLDSALLQPGRFGKVINFDYPSLDERIMFITQELRKRSIMAISDKFINEIAHELEGHSFDDLHQVITCAIQKASGEYLPVSEAHFRTAVEENIKAILPDARTLSPQETQTISTYLSGKALATKLLAPSDTISTLTIRPINIKIESKKDSKIITTPTLQYGGLFTYRNTDLLNLKNDSALMAECQIMLAGHVAQELLMGSSCYTYRPEDQQNAFNLAKQIALKGDKYEDLTENLQQAILEQAYVIKKECAEKVKALLTANSDKLSRLNETLVKDGYMTEQQISEAVK